MEECYCNGRTEVIKTIHEGNFDEIVITCVKCGGITER